MKIIGTSTSAMVKRVIINFFRQIVWMEPLRPSMVEVGSQDILDKIAALQKEFEAKQIQQEMAIEDRKQDAEESRKALEAKLAELDKEVKALEADSARIARVADRYKELHA